MTTPWSATRRLPGSAIVRVALIIRSTHREDGGSAASSIYRLVALTSATPVDMSRCALFDPYHETYLRGGAGDRYDPVPLGSRAPSGGQLGAGRHCDHHGPRWLRETLPGLSRRGLRRRHRNRRGSVLPS